MIKRMIWMLILVGLFLGSILGFQIYKSIMLKKWISAGGAPPVTVAAMKAGFDSWPQILKASGSLRAVQGVDVTTEFAGLVRSIEFKSGDKVKAGDVLIKLNADSEIARLNSLQAAVDLAQKTYDRDVELYKNRTISRQTLDIDEANLKSTMAQVEEQKAILQKKTIKAPFSGKLGITLINPGEYLNPGDKIVTLQDLDPIYVNFYLPQQHFMTLKRGQIVHLSSNTHQDKEFTGKISTIDPEVDQKTRNIQIEATISNPNQELLPGMYAGVEVIVGEPKSYLTLPQTAISFNPYGEIVYVIKEEKNQAGKTQLVAHSTFVKVGPKRGDQVAILEGIEENDLVVVSGQLKLRNGSVVLINNDVMPANQAYPQVVDE